MKAALDPRAKCDQKGFECVMSLLVDVSSAKQRLTCSPTVIEQQRCTGSQSRPRGRGDKPQTAPGSHRAEFWSVGQEDRRGPGRPRSERISDQARAVQEMNESMGWRERSSLRLSSQLESCQEGGHRDTVDRDGPWGHRVDRRDGPQAHHGDRRQATASEGGSQDRDSDYPAYRWKLAPAAQLGVWHLRRHLSGVKGHPQAVPTHCAPQPGARRKHGVPGLCWGQDRAGWGFPGSHQTQPSLWPLSSQEVLPPNPVPGPQT